MLAAQDSLIPALFCGIFIVIEQQYNDSVEFGVALVKFPIDTFLEAL